MSGERATGLRRGRYLFGGDYRGRRQKAPLLRKEGSLFLSVQPLIAIEAKITMSTQKLYNQWSATYDSVENKTRDLEKRACETVVGGISFKRVLELGGGTGKNTSWLGVRAENVMSVDFSEEMQAVAR